MKYLEARVSIHKDYSSELTNFLEDLKIPGYYEVLFDSSLPKESSSILKTNTLIKAYFNLDDVQKEIRLRIFLKSLCPDSHSLESRQIETKEYEEAYKEYYKPFRIGKIWILPIWEKESSFPVLSEEDIPLYINPGMAFGTGHHETTQMILEILPDYFPGCKRVIDLGTGSGILSIACGLLGAESVYAIDIDPNAVRSAQANWKENSFRSSSIFIAETGGLDSPSLFLRSYDLAIANITFAVLSQNIDSIAKIDTNEYIFSGITTEKKEEFLELLREKIPGNQVRSKQTNGWEMIGWQRI